MSTEYLYTITARCPLALVDDANHLACVLGTSMTDLNTYGAENFVGYSVISFAAKIDTLQTVQSGILTRPEYDVNNEIDMEAAQRAFDAMVVFAPEEDPELGMVYNFVDDPDKLIAIIGSDVSASIRMMGLTPKVEPDD